MELNDSPALQNVEVSFFLASLGRFPFIGAKNSP